MSSSSLCSSIDVGNEPDVDDVLSDELVSDIERFADYINRLRAALDPSTHVPDGETMCVSVHAALSMVSQSVRDLLVRYPIFKTSHVLMPVSQLVHSVKEINFDSAIVDASKTLTCIEKLEAAVGSTLRQSLTTKSTSNRYTTATLGRKLNKQTSHVPRTSTNGTVHHRPPLTRRHSTFQPRTSLHCDSGDTAVPLSHHTDIDAEQMDLKLVSHDDGINLAFERTKAWSKYCKDILHYVKTRIQMESEYAKKIQGLAEQSKLQMTENYVPLKEIYQKCFEADCSFSQDTFTTMKYLNERYIVPLEKRRVEHENCRRQLKNEWNKVTKQLEDCRVELKKSKANLVSREVGYKKARDQTVRLETVQLPASGSDMVRRKKEVEKRRRAEGDASTKKKEAEDNVRQLDAEMKRCREEVENSKVRIIAQLRELVYQCDQTTKACSDHYFQALANLWVRVPGKYQELSHETRTYTPGSEYMSFLQNLPGRSISSAGLLRNEKCMSDDEGQGDGLNKCPAGSQRIRRNAINPDHQEMLPEPSSVRRPKKITSRLREQAGVAPTVYSEAAKSHTLQRIRQPTKCQQCDALSIWSTYQCRVCHQAFHKSCLARLKLSCGSTSKVLTDCARRMSIFGVPLKGHLDDQNRTVPLILEKCIDELQNRGMRVKGLYRTCGVKSKVEQICEHFEKSSRDADVDLSDIHPMNIASVVKLYLRKLPDPLMTFDLYPDWIKFAKRISANELNASLASEMKELTSRLPKQNFDTLKFLVLHLARVAWFEVDNLMTASNLAAVISPSLMWCHKTTTSSNAYLEDAPLLTRTVEFIIKNAYDIFATERISDFRSFFEKYPENEQPEAVDAETEAHIEEEAEIELGEDEDDDDYDLEEDEEQICPPQTLARRISAQPPTPDLLKNTRGTAENTTSFDLEYGCPSQYSVASSNCTESSGSTSAHMHPQLEKRRSYTTSILVSPQADRRIPSMTHKQRSVDEATYTGAAVQSGDVTVEIGKGQYYLASSDRRDRMRAPNHTGSSKNSTHDDSERVCVQSVGLLFSATDNDVSYV
ncbi:hypothetical protein QR680_001267 [Steinernema hermaphroditum]|uniref:Rho-GAP domain-containing protein n=1 Tax=Steinernema hermaphroditum TaxID=289476 RepID=A0AA39GXI7_9BILA|nr:hypothetical protein QR680_001267 [Steinernema hermaphroditum]